MRHRAIILVFILAAAVAVVFFSLPRSSGDWRQISTAFAGITNSPNVSYAVISISNDGDKAVKLRSLEIEYVGIQPYFPVAGLTNLVRLTPTGTNLVVYGSRKADFLIPIPTDGRHLDCAA